MDSPETGVVLDRLVRRLTAVLDPPLRVTVVRRFMTERPPERVVATVQRLMRDVEDERHRLAYHAICQLVIAEGGLDYHVAEAVYRAAVVAECEPLRHLLLRSPALRTAELEAFRLDPQLADVPLGVRKSLARSHDRVKLLRLLYDPQVPVVAILLDNPHIVEADVVRVVARRPNRPEVLALVAGHRRWSLRYAVQLALARNPYAPPSLAAAFIPFLQIPDLEDVVDDNSVHEGVRASAAAIRGWRVARRRMVIS